jgi:uncharacterized protein YdeI (YjbR/CyaY-like superfamily)
MLIHKDLPVISFTSEAEFDTWLSQHYTDTTGFWLRYYKKGSNRETIIHDKAVDVALCWGWIDGLSNKYDDISYLVRFTPRRPKSIWSKVNVAKVERLIEAGRMQPSGLVQVEKAKADGRWDLAYQPASKMEVPTDFIELIKQDPETYAFYCSLNKTNLYAIGFRLTTISDPKKRAAKMNQLADMLKRKEKIHN